MRTNSKTNWETNLNTNMTTNSKTNLTTKFKIFTNSLCSKFQENETKKASELENKIEDWNFEPCFEDEIPKKPSEIEAPIVIESDNSINPISTKGALSDGFRKKSLTQTETV